MIYHAYPRTAWYGEDTSSIANDLTFNGQRKLLASQFDPRNKLHLNLLNGMGIVATILKEGNIQLVQTPSSAVTSQDAKVPSVLKVFIEIELNLTGFKSIFKEGEIFLHEILDLNRKRIDRKTVLVQLLSQPYLGAMILKGGPAEFGPNFDTRELVSSVIYSLELDGPKMLRISLLGYWDTGICNSKPSMYCS